MNKKSPVLEKLGGENGMWTRKNPSDRIVRNRHRSKYGLLDPSSKNAAFKIVADWHLPKNIRTAPKIKSDPNTWFLKRSLWELRSLSLHPQLCKNENRIKDKSPHGIEKGEVPLLIRTRFPMFTIEIDSPSFGANGLFTSTRMYEII